MRSAPPAPPDVLEIFLQPGDFYFGDERTRMRTLLGSCVAMVLWHPALRIGGMCHFMLPNRPHRRADAPLDGKYADEAMQLFMRELRRTCTSPAQYQAKLFGGGQMFKYPGKARPQADIAARNVECARELLKRHGFDLHAQDMGGEGHRNVIFDLWSGDVWIRRPAQQGAG